MSRSGSVEMRLGMNVSWIRPTVYLVEIGGSLEKLYHKYRDSIKRSRPESVGETPRWLFERIRYQ
jgi:hypothetical protein